MSNDIQTLILSGSGFELLVAPEAEAQKAQLLKHSNLIVVVNDPAGNDAALAQIKALAAMRILTEKSRNSVKAPVLQVGKEIDQKAASFVFEINAEENRLTSLVGEYATKIEQERRRVLREMEAARQAEEKARREEEAAAAKAAADAAAAAKAAEDAIWNDDESKAAEAAEAIAQAKADALRIEAEKEARELVAKTEAAAKMIVIPEKVAGTKFVPDFEVEDAHALYAYSSALVTLTPKRSEILELVKGLTRDGVPPVIPGLKTFMKPVTSTR